MGRDEMILQKILKVVSRNAPDSEVYLYGSRARGSAKKLSDWDLLILLNRQGIPYELETKFMDDFYELELETGVIISPLIYSRTDWNNKYSSTPLYESVKKDGIKLK